MQHIITTTRSNIFLRIISGITLSATFITSILWVTPLFYVLMSLVAVGMLFEWYKMTKTHIIHLMLGLIIIPLPVISLILVNCLSANKWLLLGYFMLIWSVDTFAMMGGKILQGTRLAPHLSPKKTWSGLIVGVISSVAVLIAFNYLIDAKITNYYKLDQLSFILSVGIIGIIAQISDLFISYFKRYHRIKDTSNIIPGHGGMLDRFDSIILTSPILFYTIYIL